ncbi:MAG: PIN-like domain-containing protein [Gemmatimonadaceae bacterium]
MRDTFRQHHRLTDAERQEIWQASTFALDANVLLNIYRYADATREDLFRVLQGLRGRVWVPYQAAKEFYARRIDVIREQRNKFEELDKELDAALTTIRAGSFRKSAFLRLEDIERTLRPAVEEAKRLVKEQRSTHPDLLHDDSYLDRFVEIIGESVGDEIEQAMFAQRCTDAQTRIDAQQPPGYRDAKKPPPERYGDVLIWYELLDLADRSKRPVIFVTDDDKEDWWQIVGGQKLGPRPELREEMRKRAGVDFYLYNPAYLLEAAGRELSIEVARSSIDDATTITSQLHERARAVDPDLFGGRPVPADLRFAVPRVRWSAEIARNAEEAVGRWLADLHPSADVVRTGAGAADFVVNHQGKTLAVEVKVLRQGSLASIRNRVRESSYRAYFELDRGLASDFLLVLVVPNEDLAWIVAHEARAWSGVEPIYPVSVGVIDTDGAYCEAGRIEHGGVHLG